MNGSNLTVNLGYIPGAGTSWPIVTVPTSGLIQGTFAGLPQGGAITVNGVAMAINYAAAGGTEVTLTVLGPPTAATPQFYTTPENTELFAPAPGLLTGATDPQGDTLHPIVLTLPTHGTLAVNDDGSFSYTPVTGYSSTPGNPDTFTYEVTDGILTSAPVTASIYVNPVNLPPVVSNVTYNAKENTTQMPESLTIPAPGVLASAVSPEGLPLTAQVVSNPSYGTLTLNANGSFTYTPAVGFTGTDSFTFTATDSNGLISTPATATINVGAVDLPLTVNPSTFGVAENSSLFVAGPGVLANVTNPSGSTLSAILVDSSAVNGSLTLNNDGSFSYTPNPNFSGVATFTFKASDGILESTNTATVTINVAPVPVTPTAGDDSYSVLENTPGTPQELVVTAPGILLNDTFPSGTPTIHVVNGPLDGTLTPDASPWTDGGFTYTPAVNFNGTDSFNYYITSDGLNSNLATVTLTVQQVLEAPFARNVAYSTNENTPLSVAAPGVLANDTDYNGLPLSAVLQTGPADGSVALNSDGSFVYTPKTNFFGTDTFTYLANDGKFSSNVATVTITVVKVDLPPTVENDSFTVEENTTLTVPAPGILATASDPNGLPLTAVEVNPPLNGTLNLNPDGGFSYTPNMFYVGTDSFTFKAYDGVLYSNLGTTTITVTIIPQTTVHLEPSSDTGESDTDRVTRDNVPTFYGTTTPGAEVILYETPAGSSAAPVQVGVTTADANGNYTVTSLTLADGSYVFSVTAFGPSGKSSGSVNAGSLLIDTVSPVVTSVIMIPKTGQIYVTYQDNASGMDLATLTNTLNYSFTRPSYHPRSYKITGAKLIPPMLPGNSPVTVALKVANGQRIEHGKYLFSIFSGGILDVAGNQLDGAYNGTFPSGDGVAGSRFNAEFLNHGFKPNVPVATDQFVPVISKTPKSKVAARPLAHHTKPGGPLAVMHHSDIHRKA